MQGLLREMKENPVTIGFLKRRVPHGVKVVSYQKLKAGRSAIFKGGKPVIVLIPRKGYEEGHFITLVPWKRSIEYFSSLGNSPQKELALLHEPLDIMMNILGKNFTYNRVQLQSGKYNINDCAAFCLARVILHKMKLRDFLSLFQKRMLRSSDDVVALMTLLHFVDK